MSTHVEVKVDDDGRVTVTIDGKDVVPAPGEVGDWKLELAALLDAADTHINRTRFQMAGRRAH